MAIRLWRRVGASAVTVVGVSFLIFAAVFLLPGDPLSVWAGEEVLTPEVEALLRERYNLDGTLWERYVAYVAGVLQGDFGSLITGRDVGELMARAWPVTLQLGLTAWVLEMAIGITVGVVSGLHPDGIFARTSWALVVTLLALPAFVVGLVLQYSFGIYLGWFPVAGVRDGWPASYILPALCIALVGSGSTTRLTRSCVETARDTDYVRMARVRGLSRWRIAVNHVLRPSLVPLVTHAGLALAAILGGVVIIESVFSLPGIGGLLSDAINSREVTVIVAVVTVFTLVVVIINLAVDLLHGLLDPRTRVA